MASTTITTFLLFSSSLLLLAFAQNSTEANRYVVQGVVLCQRCAAMGTWSLMHAKALRGAEVSIECRDHKHRVKFYKHADTDDNGYYYMPLTGFDIKDFHNATSPVHACTVQLVASASPKCNHLTDVNFGIKGTPIVYQTKLYNGTSYEADLYTAWPLAFRPTHCRPKKKHAHQH